MDIEVDKHASYDEIADAIRSCSPDDSVCCYSEASFSLAKAILVKEKLTGATVQLLDDEGYAVRQVTSKLRAEVEAKGQMTDRQIAVIKALEKVLSHCDKEGIRLLGYSDELVALPSGIDPSEHASADVVEIDTFGVYQGAETLLP